MKKENYTAILEFEVIAPTNEMEYVGEKISLSQFGEYCPENSMRGYSLLFLIDHPNHYRVTKITQRGKTLVLSPDRKQNYAPDFHPETQKFKIEK